MEHTSKQGAGTIRFERIYDALNEDVWALWTTKEGLEEWFAPEGMRCEVTALDLRVGGAFDYVMTAIGTEQAAYLADLDLPQIARVSGRIVEMVRHQRLLVRFDMDFVPGVEPYPYDMVVEMNVKDERVHMILTADRHPDPDMTRGASHGLINQLQRFDLAIAARATKERRGK